MRLVRIAKPVIVEQRTVAADFDGLFNRDMDTPCHQNRLLDLRLKQYLSALRGHVYCCEMLFILPLGLERRLLMLPKSRLELL